MLKVIQIPVLNDNYVYILHDEQTSSTAVVDPAVVEPVCRVLENHDWTLDFIFNTHHHQDHVGGNNALKEKYQCKVIGPKADHSRIPGIDKLVGDGDTVYLGKVPFHVLDVPGHTRGHIAYHTDRELFCGDTLFSLGCGRLFEGTPAQMVESLKKFDHLSDETLVYCAHEYTLNNALFLRQICQQRGLNKRAQQFEQRIKELEKKRDAGHPTIPSRMGFEREWNLFLKTDEQSLLEDFGAKNSIELFAHLRHEKDGF